MAFPKSIDPDSLVSQLELDGQVNAITADLLDTSLG
jgi:hypothetical protein